MGNYLNIFIEVGIGSFIISSWLEWNLWHLYFQLYQLWLIYNWLGLLVDFLWVYCIGISRFSLWVCLGSWFLSLDLFAWFFGLILQRLNNFDVLFASGAYYYPLHSVFSGPHSKQGCSLLMDLWFHMCLLEHLALTIVSKHLKLASSLFPPVLVHSSLSPMHACWCTYFWMACREPCW